MYPHDCFHVGLRENLGDCLRSIFSILVDLLLAFLGGYKVGGL